MIAASKVESENEEACDKVRARSAMTTDSVEDTMELGHQIAKLMATLTRAGQGNSLISVPNSPRQRGHGRGWMDRSTPGHPSSHNGWTSLGQTALVHSTSTGHGTGTTTSRDQGQSTQGSKDKQEGTANRRDSSSLQCFRCQGQGHMAWECTTPAKILNQSEGELREGGLTCHWQQLQQPTVGPQHSLPDCKPKPTTMKAAQRMGWPGVAHIPFLNPDPIAHLKGHSH